MKQYPINSKYSIQVRVEEYSGGSLKRFGWRLLRYGKPVPTNRWQYPFGRDWRRVKYSTAKFYKVFEQKVVPQIIAAPETQRLMEE